MWIGGSKAPTPPASQVRPSRPASHPPRAVSPAARRGRVPAARAKAAEPETPRAEPSAIWRAARRGVWARASDPLGVEPLKIVGRNVPLKGETPEVRGFMNRVSSSKRWSPQRRHGPHRRKVSLCSQIDASCDQFPPQTPPQLLGWDVENKRCNLSQCLFRTLVRCSSYGSKTWPGGALQRLCFTVRRPGQGKQKDHRCPFWMALVDDWTTG